MSISLDYNMNTLENNGTEENNKIKDLSYSLNDKFDPKFKTDMNTLLSMGYDQKMIRKIYIFLKPKDINEALDYLSKQNGIYHHDFMESHGQNNTCFICGDIPANHINYDLNEKKQKKSIIASIRDSLRENKIKSDLVDYHMKKDENNQLNEALINSESQDIKKDKNLNPIYCDLCSDEMNKNEIEQNKLDCNHLFCNDCYLNYLQYKITNNKVGKITCMQFKCPHEFDDNFIVSHLAGDEILINKYRKFKLRNELYKEDNIKFCPIKDCESYAKKEGDNNYVTCLEGHQFCFQCSKPWHGKKKCQDEIDKDFKKWKRNKLLKRCPKCKFWTEKNLGCNHMTCPECKYEWCWFCKKKCDVGHFKVGGECYGLQFTNKNCFNICIFLYGYKLIIWFLQQLMLIFYIPLLMIVYGFSYLENDFVERYPKFLYYMTIPLFIMCYFTLFTGLGAIFFVISLFLWCLKKKAIIFLLDLAGY